MTMVGFKLVDGDVAVVTVRSGCKARGCGGGCGMADPSGSKGHCSEGPGGGSGAEGPIVVVVLDDVVGVIDGDCVGIVGSDVAASRGVLGCSTKVWVAVSMVWGVAWMLKLTGAGAGVVWVL
jgi:hypothetical protein